MAADLTDDVRMACIAVGPGRADPSVTLRSGGRDFPVLRMWPDGFSVDAGDAVALRGRVEVFSGAEFIGRGLAVATEATAGEQRFTFKEFSLARSLPPRDFVVDDDLPPPNPTARSRPVL
ncbi:hypothetical protein LX81_00800 [Palleronia aestuarii]|uniref:Uncharacterized protein n=2 Tax=Palleronia aestuarii TaxID=568105 RepID=A0A2W7NGW7_9RHOB|nr:hypothetical protein LX81_00800 [Palleronia aestuarii]